MFYQTKRHGFVNLDHVLRVTVEDAGRDTHGNNTFEVRYYLTDDSVLSETVVGHWPEIPAPMMPASPSYFVLTHGTDEGGSFASRVPVIGWERRADGQIVPVRFDEIYDAGGAVILLPDGRVIEPYSATYDSEADWLAEMEKRDRERAAKIPKIVK